MYVSRTRKEIKFSGHDENCQQNASDLEGSLVTSSRPPGRPQNRPDEYDRTSNGGVAAQAADGSQRTASVADEQCLTKKGKGFPYSLPSVGPGADPGVQAVSPQSSIPRYRLPLLSARPAVTFPAAQYHRPLAGIKLYCLVTEAYIGVVPSKMRSGKTYA